MLTAVITIIDIYYYYTVSLLRYWLFIATWEIAPKTMWLKIIKSIYLLTILQWEQGCTSHDVSWRSLDGLENPRWIHIHFFQWDCHPVGWNGQGKAEFLFLCNPASFKAFFRHGHPLGRKVVRLVWIVALGSERARAKAARSLKA